MNTWSAKNEQCTNTVAMQSMQCNVFQCRMKHEMHYIKSQVFLWKNACQVTQTIEKDHGKKK